MTGVSLRFILPLLPQHPHINQVDILPIAPDMLAEAAFFYNTAGPIGPDGPFVGPVNTQTDPAHIPQPEGITEEQGDCLPAIALSPVILVSNGDTQHAR